MATSDTLVSKVLEAVVPNLPAKSDDDILPIVIPIFLDIWRLPFQAVLSPQRRDVHITVNVYCDRKRHEVTKRDLKDEAPICHLKSAAPGRE